MVVAREVRRRLNAAKGSAVRWGWALVSLSVLAALAGSAGVCAAAPQPHLSQPHLSAPSLSQPTASASAATANSTGSQGNVSAQSAPDPIVLLSPAGLHFEQNNSAIPAPLTLPGRILGAPGNYRLAIWTTGDEIKFTVPRVKNSSESSKAPDIPMSWELRYRSGGEWGPWQPAGTGTAPGLPEGALWWVLPVVGGPCDFELRSSLQTEPYQPPGHYQRSLTVDVHSCEAPASSPPPPAPAAPPASRSGAAR
jgi:hypothetical protein